MTSRHALFSGLAGLMVGVAACAQSEQTSNTTAASAQASPTAEASARTSRSGPAVERCPAGELCNGVMGSGEYTSDAVADTTVSLTLQSDWEAQVDREGGFINLYHQNEVPAIIGIAEMPGEVFTDPCSDEVTQQIDRTPQAFMDWLAGHPAIQMGETAPVTLGEATGLQVELTAAKAEPCAAESRVQPDVILLWPLEGPGAFLLADNTTAIAYAVEIDGDLLVVTAETIFDPEEWRPVVQPVLESIEFAVAR